MDRAKVAWSRATVLDDISQEKVILEENASRHTILAEGLK
jgi:hypothetical protein